MAPHRGRLDLELPKVKLTKENLREAATLFSYLRVYRGLLFAACCALVLTSILNLCFPFLAGALMDAAMPAMSGRGPAWLPHRINSVAALMLFVLAVQAAATFFLTTAMTRLCQRVVADLRRDTC